MLSSKKKKAYKYKTDWNNEDNPGFQTKIQLRGRNTENPNNPNRKFKGKLYK